MISLQLDEKNNILGFGELQTVGGVEAVKQDLKNMLLMFKTEYPFDLKMGIDYYNLATNNNRVLIKNEIIKRICEDTRVQSVTKCELSFKNKVLQVNATVLLSDGELINV